LLIAFGIGCLIRLVPLAISYPYPVGYDTINYYLPNLYHFDSNWVNLVTEFPTYIATVYLFSLVFSADVYHSFLASNVLLYGFFSVTIYLLSNKILNQPLKVSLAFTVFVVFQLGALRISWDLFRDLFSLIMFNLFLLLIYYVDKKSSWNHFISILAIFSVSILTVFSDRMIGMLLIFVSFAFSLIYKQKYLFAINALFTFSFLFYFLTFDRITFFSANVNFLEMLLNPLYERNTFSGLDISVLFLSLYGVLVPFFAYGFLKTKLKDSVLIIKVPLLFTLFLSFTWVFVPNYGYLVPERWLLILGIYMSLIAIHGFFLIVDSSLGLKKKNKKARKGIVFLFLLLFVAYGSLFATMPYGVTFSLPSLFQESTGFIFPLSMLFNSLDIKDNLDMVRSIDWINSNTAKDFTIVGTKHWRGWFSLFLDQPRKYIFTESFVNPDNVVSSDEKGRLNFSYSLERNLTSYLCSPLSSDNINSYPQTRHTYPPVYFIDYGDKAYGDDDSFLSKVEYKSKKFVIYDLSGHVCNS